MHYRAEVLTGDYATQVGNAKIKQAPAEAILGTYTACITKQDRPV